MVFCFSFSHAHFFQSPLTFNSQIDETFTSNLAYLYVELEIIMKSLIFFQ